MNGWGFLICVGSFTATLALMHEPLFRGMCSLAIIFICRSVDRSPPLRLVAGTSMIYLLVLWAFAALRPDLYPAEVGDWSVPANLPNSIVAALVAGKTVLASFALLALASCVRRASYLALICRLPNGYLPQMLGLAFASTEATALTLQRVLEAQWSNGKPPISPLPSRVARLVSALAPFVALTILDADTRRFASRHMPVSRDVVLQHCRRQPTRWVLPWLVVSLQGGALLALFR